ncbi:hypothetical protein C3E88_03270 [Clostridium sp. Cult3]|nr:hypothetical protein [Clostridium sp. Cult3]
MMITTRKWNFQPTSLLRKIKMNNLPKNQGLTLLELILTIALLGIVSLLVFSFFQFNYNTFNKSVDKYDVQSNLNSCRRKIEGELKFATEINIYEERNSFKLDKNYIFLDENTIKLQTSDGKLVNLLEGNILANSLQFKQKGNLLNLKLEAKINNEIFITDLSIELLNILDSNTDEKEGAVIEYTSTKGDDTY